MKLKFVAFTVLTDIFYITVPHFRVFLLLHNKKLFYSCSVCVCVCMCVGVCVCACIHACVCVEDN